MPYVVYVDDNAHYQDDAERYRLGEFERYDDAVQAAQGIVDRFLEDHQGEYTEASSLFQAYTQYGDDSFIVPDDDVPRFSARTYARAKCDQLYALR